MLCILMVLCGFAYVCHCSDVDIPSTTSPVGAFMNAVVAIAGGLGIGAGVVLGISRAVATDAL